MRSYMNCSATPVETSDPSCFLMKYNIISIGEVPPEQVNRSLSMVNTLRDTCVWGKASVNEAMFSQ